MLSWTARRRCAGALAVGVLATSCGAPAPAPTAEARQAESAPEAGGDHRFCAWLLAFPDEPALTEQAYDTFAAHADELDAVHPVWWRVDSPTTIVNHPDGDEKPYPGFHDARVLSRTTPGGGRTKLVPMIGASRRPDYVHVHHMINDPGLRARHVRAVVELAVENHYDGIDIDYEHIDPHHLGSDLVPPQSWATERLAYSTFIAELARALHEAGKTLSLAGPVDDSPDAVFDYAALSAAADQIHLMGYDYHYSNGDHAGPLSPLGWVEHGVAAIGSVAGGRRRSQFILGLPNYGLMGPETARPPALAKICVNSQRCADLAGGDYAVTTDHMDHCPDIAPARVDPGRAPNAALPSGDHLFFEDLGSLEERVLAARRAGLGGITYWAIGGEPGEPGAFFEMVRRHFPSAPPGGR
jgi:spore germination protein YaaH